MTKKPAMGKPRFETDKCANCFQPLPDDLNHRPQLFCSELCQSTASTIRYWRKTSRNGNFESDPDVRYAIGVSLAHMLNGGYKRTARRLPADVRVLVIERDRVCRHCGNAGEEIDHIDGDSGDPGNLQLLCKACHRAKSAAHLIPAAQSQQDRIFALLIQRVVPDMPAQLCDDEASWQNVERRLRSERLERLRTSEEQRAKQEKAAADALALDAARESARARLAAAAWFDDEDDDDERADDYYAGFGENSHYM